VPLLTAESPEARVHSWAKALLVSDALQQHRQLFAFLVGERRAQRLLMFSRDLGDAPQHVSPFARQIKSVAPAIARLIASLHQAALFKIIDQRHEAARRDPEFGSERLLADPFCGLDDSKNSCISRNKSGYAKSLGEHGGGMASNLRKEKCR
jgi:hypothetical protein